MSLRGCRCLADGSERVLREGVSGVVTATRERAYQVRFLRARLFRSALRRWMLRAAVRRVGVVVVLLRGRRISAAYR
jgi:hypothetical protein